MEHLRILVEGSLHLDEEGHFESLMQCVATIL